MIYQEFNLALALSIYENIFRGKEKLKGILIDKNTMIKEASKLMQELGITIDPRTKIRDLPLAYQQLVGIAKEISKDVKVLIMDEPTAPLTNNEVKVLFKIVRQLKEKGVTIILFLIGLRSYSKYQIE